MRAEDKERWCARTRRDATRSTSGPQGPSRALRSLRVTQTNRCRRLPLLRLSLASRDATLSLLPLPNKPETIGTHLLATTIIAYKLVILQTVSLSLLRPPTRAWTAQIASSPKEDSTARIVSGLSACFCSLQMRLKRILLGILLQSAQLPIADPTCCGRQRRPHLRGGEGSHHRRGPCTPS